MTTTPFRQHDDAPEDAASPLLRQLFTEWVALNRSPASRVTLRRWARVQPALSGLERPGDVVDAIDAASPDGRDDLMRSLVTLFLSGHQLAGRVLLQAMLPKLVTMAHWRAGPGNATRIEERHHLAVAEFWSVLGGYPLERRPSRIAANLAMDTQHRLTADAGCREVFVDPADLAADRHLTAETTTDNVADEAIAATAAAAGHLTAGEDLVQVVTWGVRKGAITPAEASLLHAIYGTRSGAYGAYGFEEEAATARTSARTVRKRCSRAVGKLRAAYQADLGAYDLSAAQVA